MVRWIDGLVWLDDAIEGPIRVEAMDLCEVMRFNEQKEFVEEVIDFDGGFIGQDWQVDFDRH